MVTVNLGGGDTDILLSRDPSVVIGDAVYLSASDTVDRANALSSATGPAIGFVTSLVGLTQCMVRCEKTLTGFSGLTPGASVFLDLVDGGTNQDVSGYTPGQVVQELGLAVNPTTILVRIDTDATVLS